VIQLAGQGAKVVLVARRAGRLEAVSEECRRAGGEARAIATDVSDESQCKALVEKNIAQFGHLDMLVNNAGMTVTAEQCAQVILRMAANRHREVLMSPGRLATWLNVISPAFMDWFAVKVFLQSTFRRACSRRKEKQT
jgi:NAD(P)-dependent dehydrogenase (short-subunit alcohol dehydrogenase family)